MEKAATATLPLWPDFPSSLDASRPTYNHVGTSYATRKSNRMRPAQHATTKVTHKPSSGWNWSPDRENGEVRSVVRSDTLCVFVAPTIPIDAKIPWR